jgi:hypothetical protein
MHRRALLIAITNDPFKDLLIDFEYEISDGKAILTAWKGTLNGEPSTELIIPDDERIIL